MRRRSAWLLLLPALLAVGGAAAGSALSTLAGGVAVLVGLALLIPPAVPRTARLLLCGGLALLAVVIVLRVRSWTAWAYDGGDLFAYAVDPDRDRSQFRWQSAEAAALVLAGAVLVVALLQARRGRWRRDVAEAAGRARLRAERGDAAGVARLRAGRGDVAGVAGLALLAWSAWSAAGAARAARPTTRNLDAFLQPGARMSVAVEPGPDINTHAAVAVAVLLAGAALTVLASSSLPRTAGALPTE